MKFLMHLALTLLLSFGLGLSQHALGAANPDDETLKRDNARIENSDASSINEGTPIAEGIECRECKKNAKGGFHNEGPKIEPAGERPSKAEPTKGNRVND
ncbi:MAG: hypothetical protein IPJ84_01405 [Bdellovibrionales bacterium]|nr:hypothetical protein [Bdellovibrionales bacterium]